MLCKLARGIYAILFRLIFLLWAQRRERRGEALPSPTATPGGKANRTAPKDVRAPTTRTRQSRERGKRKGRAAGRPGAAGMHVLGGTRRTRGIFPARTERSAARRARRRRCIQTAAARPASPLPAAGSASKAQSRYMYQQHVHEACSRPHTWVSTTVIKLILNESDLDVQCSTFIGWQQQNEVNLLSGSFHSTSQTGN